MLTNSSFDFCAVFVPLLQLTFTWQRMHTVYYHPSIVTCAPHFGSVTQFQSYWESREEGGGHCISVALFSEVPSIFTAIAPNWRDGVKVVAAILITSLLYVTVGPCNGSLWIQHTKVSLLEPNKRFPRIVIIDRDVDLSKLLLLIVLHHTGSCCQIIIIIIIITTTITQIIPPRLGLDHPYLFSQPHTCIEAISLNLHSRVKIEDESHGYRAKFSSAKSLRSGGGAGAYCTSQKLEVHLSFLPLLYPSLQDDLVKLDFLSACSRGWIKRPR